MMEATGFHGTLAMVVAGVVAAGLRTPPMMRWHSSTCAALPLVPREAQILFANRPCRPTLKRQEHDRMLREFMRDFAFHGAQNVWFTGFVENVQRECAWHSQALCSALAAQ